MNEFADNHKLQTLKNERRFLVNFLRGFENDDEIDKELGLVNSMKYELQKTAKKQLEECDAKIAKLTSEKD